MESLSGNSPPDKVQLFHGFVRGVLPTGRRGGGGVAYIILHPTKPEFFELAAILDRDRLGVASGMILKMFRVEVLVRYCVLVPAILTDF